MTTHQMKDRITEAEAATFLANLDTWTRELTPRERACLAALLVVGTDEGDVAGFLLLGEAPSGTGAPPPPTLQQMIVDAIPRIFTLI